MNTSLKTRSKPIPLIEEKSLPVIPQVEADLKVPVYFADAYSSCKEEVMKMPMDYFENSSPKKTDLARVTEKEVNEALCLINHRPPKMFRLENFI